MCYMNTNKCVRRDTILSKILSVIFGFVLRIISSKVITAVRELDGNEQRDTRNNLKLKRDLGFSD